MKLFKSSLVALALAMSTGVQAERVAITNAKIYTSTEQGVLENATVVIDDGKIFAINPESVAADRSVDAQGKILTPGLISSMNQLGLVEVGAVARSRDAGDKKADLTFDASYAFNPKSTVIPYTRKGGITQDVVFPMGGDSIYLGQTFVVELTGDYDSVVKKNQALIVELGAKSSGSRALDMQSFVEKLEDAQKAKKQADKEKKDDKKKAKTVKRGEQVIQDVLAGNKQVVIDVERASDILHVLAIKERFNLDVVLAGAADAVVVAEQIAKAKVPVIMSATTNLPSSFDSLHNSLENAGKLHRAGVKVVLTAGGDTHNMYQLRFNAGLAVANGMPYDAAMAAITSNVADAFHLDGGKIAVGEKADIALWNADPFELSSKVEKLWINGKEQSLRSRQDALRDRYLKQSDMPKAYTK